MNQVYEELDGKAFVNGDAAGKTDAKPMDDFLTKLKLVRSHVFLYCEGSLLTLF